LGVAEQTPRDLLAGNIAAAMARRKLQQSDVAERMNALGYRWTRQIVSEVVNRNRGVRAEELYGLSMSLELPLALLLYPWAGDGAPEVRLPSGLALTFSMQFAAQSIPSAEPPFLWEGNSLRFKDAPVHEHAAFDSPHPSSG
jgi:transcriptional regulator with XRE-family HTH domain